MEERKTKITDFIKYLEINQLAAARVLSALKCIDMKLYKQFDNIDYIEDIECLTFIIMRNVGKKSWVEFEELREEYLQYLHSFKCEELPREEYRCWLRSDISNTLKTIKDERSFVETALLEKFKRDRIELVELKKENA